MNNREAYNNSASYETFLKRAFKYDRRLTTPSNQELLNLIDAEKGEKVSFLPTKEKQFNAIRERVLKAILLLAKQKLPKENRQNLKSLLPELEAAYNSDDIIEIVSLGLNYSQPLINN